MPFAGSLSEARSALDALDALDTAAGDELIMVDNVGLGLVSGRIRIAVTTDEASPAHARNRGAAEARAEWILFLDADCRAPADLLERYFLRSAGARVGALVGEVVPDARPRTLAERYATARNFLSQQAHMAHPYLPRYRATVADLRRQWRAYAAGRAWLAREYDGFTPEPALLRALRRLLGRRPGRGDGRAGAVHPAAAAIHAPEHAPAVPRPGPVDRARFLALDALLALEELIGFLGSNEARRR
jgi:glycosyltransferase involved in cell wall biosynthesis